MMHLYIFWIIAGLLTAFCVLLLLRPLGKTHSAVAVMAFVPLIALGIYVYLGRPDLTQWQTRQQLPPFIAASVDKLIQDAHDHPTDVQAWVLLGDVYARIRRYGEAADAYRHAAFLDSTSETYKAMVGQSLVMQNGGAVGDDAMAWFAQAKADPTSRYYLALEKSQEGDWKSALADWQKLQTENPQGMGPSLAARIADARAALGMDQH